jgi:hypothetical protein
MGWNNVLEAVAGCNWQSHSHLLSHLLTSTGLTHRTDANCTYANGTLMTEALI